MTIAAYERIKKAGALPSPSGTALQILDLVNNQDTTIKQITTAVGTDPSLASRLLKLVNSPIAGVSRRIASVAQAVGLLGLETVKGVALGFSLISAYKRGECQRFDYEAFWSEAAGRAVAARHVANKLTNFPVDEAFTCGLLCQIGRLALATVYPKTYAAALDDAVAAGAGMLNAIERAVFQIDHNALAAEMMTDWHLPNVFCDAVRFQDCLDAVDLDSSTTTLGRLLHFSGSVSILLTRLEVVRESLTALYNEANRFGIRPDVVDTVFDSISDEWRTVGQILAVPTRRVPALAELYTMAR